MATITLRALWARLAVDQSAAQSSSIAIRVPGAPGSPGTDGAPGPNIITLTTAVNSIPALFLLRVSTDGTHVDQLDPATFAPATHTHPASAIDSGTLADSRLSSNVPRINGANTFTGSNCFAGSFNETTSVAGLYVGITGGSSRVAFVNGTPSQTWQIDNFNGTFRWFQPGITGLSLTQGVTGSAGGLTVGGRSYLRERVTIQAVSSTGWNECAYVDAYYSVATHAIRNGRYVVSVIDYSGPREAMRCGANGTAPTIGFLGASEVARQTLPAAATDLASTIALANAIRTALINFGLCQ